MDTLTGVDGPSPFYPSPSSIAYGTGASDTGGSETGTDDPGSTTELHAFYYFGASITLASSLFVIFSYIKFRACRQHPSSLIFWRSMSDVIFSLQFIILFSDSDRRDHCAVYSFLFQFSVLASQSWYFMNAVDLLRSMLNPFTDPKSNIPIYHVFVWSMSLVTSIAIDASGKDHYRPDMQLCWTSVQSGGALFNYANWLTFFIPTLCYYFFSIGTMIYAGLRLKKGLQETFVTRQIVLFNGIRYVAGFCAYWTFAGIIYGIIMLRSQNNDASQGSPSRTGNLPLYATFAVTIAFRGVVDVCIWVYNQKVHEIYRLWWRGEPHDDPKDIGMNDADINRALRREVLIFSTTGIALSIERANGVPFSEVIPTIEQYPVSLDPTEPRNMHSIVRTDVHRTDVTDKILASATSPRALEEARTRAASIGPEGAVPFMDYAPQVFRFLRFHYGINENDYAVSIQGKTEAMIEKFTEGGRSGSFFYFSEDSRYIVKTLTETEAVFLVRWLPRYVEYMSKNRNSLITRFCGFHSLRLYNLTIHFIVMQSVFLTQRKVHERYDLKGSWVDRHADSSSKKDALNTGTNRIGGFKAGVYKDNDLNRPVRLSEKDRLLFLHQIRKDAYFLRDCNIMDYSLLLGVHHTSHVVPVLSPSPSSNNLPTPLTTTVTNGSIDHTNSSLHDQIQLTPTSPRPLTLLHVPFARNVSASSGPVGIFTKDDGGIQASIIEGPGLYFFGLIDILQEYNTSKKLERFAKRYFRCKDGEGISSMPPIPYAERFVKFMSNMTREDEEGLNLNSSLLPVTIIDDDDDSKETDHHPLSQSPLVGRERLFDGLDSSHYEQEHPRAVQDGSIQPSVISSFALHSPAPHQSDAHAQSSFLNPSTLASTHALSIHPASDPTTSAISSSSVSLTNYPQSDTTSTRSGFSAMGITDSAHETRSSTTTTEWSSI